MLLLPGRLPRVSTERSPAQRIAAMTARLAATTLAHAEAVRNTRSAARENNRDGECPTGWLTAVRQEEVQAKRASNSCISFARTMTITPTLATLTAISLRIVKGSLRKIAARMMAKMTDV